MALTITMDAPLEVWWRWVANVKRLDPGEADAHISVLPPNALLVVFAHHTSTLVYFGKRAGSRWLIVGDCWVLTCDSMQVTF